MATAAMVMFSIENLMPRSTWDKYELASPEISSV